MTNLFGALRQRPFGYKAAALLGYGLLTFIGVALLGTVVFDNPIIFRIFEFLWFVHIVIICNQLQRSQNELIALALIALSPGIVNNVLALFWL
jgi:hypothetical protein